MDKDTFFSMIGINPHSTMLMSPTTKLGYTFINGWLYEVSSDGKHRNMISLKDVPEDATRIN